MAPESLSVWTEAEGGFRTKVREVDIQLDVVPARGGDQLFLTLSCAGQRACIAEPPDLGFLQHKYESEDKQRLSILLRDLARRVVRQCADRREEVQVRQDNAREWLFRRLLFDEDQAPDVDRTANAAVPVSRT